MKNTDDLRKLLMNTIQSLRRGRLDVKKAMAVANLSGRILQSADLDLKYLKYADGAKAFEKPLLLGKKPNAKKA